MPDGGCNRHLALPIVTHLPTSQTLNLNFMLRFRPLLLPLLLFIVALVPRLIGLQWGLPSAAHWYSYHPDEKQISDAVANLYLTGSFNPHFFNYPSLYIYLVYCTHWLASGFGWAHGPSLALPIWLDPNWLHDVLLIGRAITALLGAATVPLVYGIGHRISNAPVGIFAALLLAFLPGHVQHSHFTTVDVPATFFITLSLWFAVLSLCSMDAEAEENTNSFNRQARKFLFASAIVAGLAAATKYNAGVILIAPLPVLFHYRNRGSMRLLIPLLTLAALGFLIGCPYSVLSFQEFWGSGANGFAYEMFVHPREGSGELFKNTGNGWWYHLTFNLPFIITWPLEGVALIGLVAAVLYRKRGELTFTSDKENTSTLPDYSAAWLMLLIWVAAYFLPLALSQVRFMRYLLPLAPVLCIFTAVSIPLLLRGKAKSGVSIAHSLLCLIALIGTANVVSLFVIPDPRDQAAQFVKAQAPRGTSIGLLTPPWFWTPPLRLYATPPGTSAEELRKLGELTQDEYSFVVTGFDIEALDRDKPAWFVMSELEWREQARLGDIKFQSFMKRLEANYTLRSRFKNQAPLALPGRDFVPHDYLYTNPEIRVYQRR